ncbi:hypothetical protein EDD21DRAFT_376867 [Dissophora ornata]|nr:hypothetical protein BGZ58_006469 [Dissophora ornata]KAI8600544.1 hypothetical protein EDD21DRAFT_376867 [Dissophora ornata]
MIRRAAYQEVIVVDSTLQQQPKRDGQTGTANESQGEINVFKVPIHLVKRQRAVLVKDIKRVAPQLETIRTEHGTVLFSRTAGGDTLSSTSPPPSSSSSSQQQEPSFIPLPDDPEESVWYIHTRPTDAMVVKSGSSQHTESSGVVTVGEGRQLVDPDAELELNPGIEKESITKKVEGLLLTTSAPPTTQTEGEGSTTLSDQGFNEGESEKQEEEDHNPTRSRLSSSSQSGHSVWSRSSMSSAQGKLTTLQQLQQLDATTTAPASTSSPRHRRILSTSSASSSFTSARAVPAAPGVAPRVLDTCTGECQQITDTMRDQLLDLARALLSVLDDPEAIKNDDEEIERIRGIAANALKSCDAVELEPEQHGLMTPEATPVSTPVISGHACRRSSGWSQDHSVSGTGNGNSREDSDHGQSQGRGQGHGLATLVLPNAMLPIDDQDLEHDQSIYDRRGPMLQDSVSHFSAYSMNFPDHSITAPQADLSETLLSTTTKGKRASGSLTQLKSKNPFMAIFGKTNSAQEPLDDTEDGGVGSSGTITTMTKKSQNKDKKAKGMKSKWFKSKRRDAEGHAEREADQSTSTTVAASGSGSESSVSLSASVTTPGNLSTSSSVSSSSSTPSGLLTTPLNLTSTAPTTLLQPSHRPQQRQRQQQTRPSTTTSTGPVACTATGSFFDSVSDDDSDSDEEEVLQRTQRTRVRPASQHAATGSAIGHYQQQQYVRMPLLQLYEQRQGQVRDRDVETDSESDQGEHEEDNESEEDIESEEDDEDSLEVVRRHQHQDDTRPHSYTSQARVFNPRTLQGYMHQFDDAPPPSYHSSIHDHGNNNDFTAVSPLHPPSAPVQHQRRLSSISMSSSPWSPSPSSISLLQTLLDLLHQFEDHLLDQHKTPSFRSADTAAATITNTNTLNSGRQSWRSRHPQTIASFAYVLIELEQTGILPSAMCTAWSGQNTACISATASTNTPASAPSSPPPSPSPYSSTTPSSAAVVAEMSEQDWLSMTGNASTEMHLAKAMLVLEQSCVHGMDLGRWRNGDAATTTTVREEWIAKVQNIVA